MTTEVAMDIGNEPTAKLSPVVLHSDSSEILTKSFFKLNVSPMPAFTLLPSCSSVQQAGAHVPSL
jgi:hypothetical protein